jgi:MFS family permease
MDLAFEAVGTKGKFQKILIFLSLVSTGIIFIPGVAFPFLTNKPALLCKEKGNDLYPFQACHQEQLCKDDLYEYKKDPLNSLINWTYEFDLYCSREFYLPMIGTSFFLGAMVGSILFSWIPDQDGRARLYKALMSSLFIFHVLPLLFANGPIFIIMNNFMAGVAGYCSSLNTLVITEMLDRESAGMVMSFASAVFPITGILVAFFFMFINNWRILYAITSIIAMVLAYTVNKYMVESPRWLNSKNKVLETLDALKTIARVNGNEKVFETFLSVNASKIFYIEYLLLIIYI